MRRAPLARQRHGEAVPEVEVQRIANESECAAGWGWACGKAGWAFYQGEGAPENPARALALSRTGCETALTKDQWCCGMAGILYVDGTGVSSDPTEGARWLAKGCETADPQRADLQACERLGLLAAEGRGVPKDVVRARALFKKACDSKYQTACEDLSRYSGSQAPPGRAHPQRYSRQKDRRTPVLLLAAHEGAGPWLRSSWYRRFPSVAGQGA